MPRILLALLLVCPILVGCRDPNDMDLKELNGKATCAGEAILVGTVAFIPDTGKDHKGPAGRAEIINGQYDTRNYGKGILPGPYRVLVTAYQTESLKSNGDESLFENYLINVELKDPVWDFDVPKSAIKRSGR